MAALELVITLRLRKKSFGLNTSINSYFLFLILVGKKYSQKKCYYGFRSLHNFACLNSTYNKVNFIF